MRKIPITLIALLTLFSCGQQDKSVVVTNLIEEKKFNEAIDFLPLDTCKAELIACGMVGVGLLSFGGKEFSSLGKSYLDKSALLGNMKAKSVLGNFLLSGTYYDKAVKQGIKLLHEASDGGDDVGLYYLGFEYYSGANIPKDLQKAFELFDESAKLGHKYAPFYAGITHYEMHNDCHVAEKYFAVSAQYMEPAAKALKEIRTENPCAKVLNEI